MGDGIIYMSIGRDGGGPGVFARACGRALVEVLRDLGWNPRFVLDHRENVDGDKLKTSIEKAGGVVHTMAPWPPRSSLLWLPRNEGQLAPELIEPRVLLPFREALESYTSAFDERLHDIRRSYGRVALVVGVVEPGAVHAAARLGLPALLIGDHLWDVTLRKILTYGNCAVSQQGADVLDLIGRVAASANEVWLWPSPVTPDVHAQAASACGARVNRLAGVVSSAPDISKNAVEKIRLHYGIEDGLPIVCVTAGALGPLRDSFAAVKTEFSRKPPEGYHVILDEKPCLVFRSEHNEPHIVERLHLEETASVVEVFFMRCGASTDTAIGARRPWVSLLEPGHWQVNAMAEAAEYQCLAPVLPPAQLALTPRFCLESELSAGPARARRYRARAALARIPVDAARPWAETIATTYLS